MAKLNIDSLSQARRLLNLSEEPGKILNNYTNACVIFSEDDTQENELNLTINWRDLGCKMGTEGKVFKLTGSEVITYHFSNNQIERINYRTRNLKLMTGTTEFYLNIDAQMLINNTLSEVVFTQNLFVTRQENSQEVEFDITTEAHGLLNTKTNHLAFSAVSFDTKYEKFKRNKSMNKVHTTNHKMISNNLKDSFLDSCGLVMGEFNFENHYNLKIKEKSEINAGNKDYYFKGEQVTENRVSCNARDPFIFKTLSIYLNRFKSYGSGAIGSRKSKAENETEDENKNKDKNESIK